MWRKTPIHSLIQNVPWLPNQSDFPPISWPWYRAWLWTSVQIWWNIVSGLCFTRNHSPCLLRWSCLQTSEGQRRSEFHLVGLENSETPCTLTNKAVGTIWRALSKPPQRRQGPDPRPLWLLVGTPSAFGPELAYRLRVAQPTLMDVTRYFDILLYYYTCLCTTFLWPLHFGWLLVLSLHKEDYLQIF